MPWKVGLTIESWAALESVIGTYGYAIIALVTFLETSAFIGLIAPGEVTLVVGGVLAYRGTLSLGTVMWVAGSGAIVGDIVSYGIGRRFGPQAAAWFVKRLPLSQVGLQAAERLMKRYGVLTFFIGRFAVGTRALTPFVAGTFRVPFPRFIIPDTLSAILWVVSISALGYLFARSTSWLLQTLGYFSGGMLLLVVLIVAFTILHLRRNKWANK